MTTPATRLATVLAAPGGALPPDTILREGTVVQVGPPVQVDTGNLSLSCDKLATITVGDLVYVLSCGNLNVILGVALEVWRNVGDVGQPAFAGSWTNFGGGYVPLRFRKEDGRVYVEGTVKSGSSGSTLFTLPTGYRPASKLQRWIRGANTVDQAGIADLDTSGVMTIQTPSGTGAYSAVSLGFDFAVD